MMYRQQQQGEGINQSPPNTPVPAKLGVGYWQKAPAAILLNSENPELCTLLGIRTQTPCLLDMRRRQSKLI